MLACAVYFWARVAHIIVYTLGLPVFRTLAFTVGFLAQAVLALAIFRTCLKARLRRQDRIEKPRLCGRDFVFPLTMAAPGAAGSCRLPPQVSAKPSISRMFWTAAPEAPLPRLSRRATRTACGYLGLAKT